MHNQDRPDSLAVLSLCEHARLGRNQAHGLRRGDGAVAGYHHRLAGIDGQVEGQHGVDLAGGH